MPTISGACRRISNLIIFVKFLKIFLNKVANLIFYRQNHSAIYQLLIMAVPKKKTAKSKSKVRYSAFQKKAQKKIADKVQLENCPECKAKKLVHRVCEECGKYRGKQILVEKKQEKTRISA